MPSKRWCFGSGVWLGWQYTCWVTNWCDPEARAIRLMLFALMLVALVMAAATPQAFGARGLMFALAYVTIQVGRTAYVSAYSAAAIRSRRTSPVCWAGS